MLQVRHIDPGQFLNGLNVIGLQTQIGDASKPDMLDILEESRPAVGP
jgi:hypothetical protein